MARQRQAWTRKASGSKANSAGKEAARPPSKANSAGKEAAWPPSKVNSAGKEAAWPPSKANSTGKEAAWRARDGVAQATSPKASPKASQGRSRGRGMAAPTGQKSKLPSGLPVAPRSDEDLELLKMLEADGTAEQVLDRMFEHLFDLSPEMTVEALHLVARRMSASQQGLSSSEMLPPVLMHLWQGVAELRNPRSLSQLPWTLGKLFTRADANSPLPQHGMDDCLLHVCGLLPDILGECSHVDLTNTLWGLARLFPGGASGAAGGVPQVNTVAHAIIRECTEKLSGLTAQCLANSFWAMARLKVHGPDVEEYVAQVLAQLRSAEDFGKFSSQGLANMLWSLAQLHVAGVGRGRLDGQVQQALVPLAEACSRQLAEFQPQELSMVVWSFAKLYESRKGDRSGSARKGRCSARPQEVDSMLMELASVAARGISKFESQGISNIAWALATLELAGPSAASAPAREFMDAAMSYCVGELGGFSTQAVANLLWACVRVEFPGRSHKKKQTLRCFCSTAAQVMTARMSQHKFGTNVAVTWRDLSSVATALSHSRQNSPEMAGYMSMLVTRTAEQVAKGNLTSQQILNIAQSAARMQMPPSEMQTLVNNIERRIATGGFLLNDVDSRQWGEVQQWCPPSSFSCCGPYGDLGDGYALPMMALDGSPMCHWLPMLLPEQFNCDAGQKA